MSTESQSPEKNTFKLWYISSSLYFERGYQVWRGIYSKPESHLKKPPAKKESGSNMIISPLPIELLTGRRHQPHESSPQPNLLQRFQTKQQRSLPGYNEGQVLHSQQDRDLEMPLMPAAHRTVSQGRSSRNDRKSISNTKRTRKQSHLFSLILNKKRLA